MSHYRVLCQSWNSIDSFAGEARTTSSKGHGESLALLLTSVQAAAAGVYWVEVTSAADQVTSQQAVLTVDLRSTLDPNCHGERRHERVF